MILASSGILNGGPFTARFFSRIIRHLLLIERVLIASAIQEARERLEAKTLREPFLRLINPGTEVFDARGFSNSPSFNSRTQKF